MALGGVLNMQTDLTNLLVDVIESMLPRFSGKLALHFTLKFSVDFWGTDEEDNERHETACVEFLVHRPNNYTKVYMRTFDGMRPSTPGSRSWRKTSDHDSGWRHDGFSDLAKILADLTRKFDESIDRRKI